MRRIYFNRFPGGKSKAVTLSYDDGQIHDRRLVEILNQFHMKGTFHLNSGTLDEHDHIKSSEVKELYKGHEVSVHTVTHPSLLNIPRENVIHEILDDKKALEKLVGYPVRGMSYPYGIFDDEIVKILPDVGMEYARTVNSSGKLYITSNLLKWEPTCHHGNNLLERGKHLLTYGVESVLPLLYVWGHSFEFHRNNDWEVIEEFCKLVANQEDIWYATNIEVVDYVNALKRLVFTVEQDMVFNPSCIPVWISADKQTIRINAGETISI